MAITEKDLEEFNLEHILSETLDEMSDEKEEEFDNAPAPRSYTKPTKPVHVTTTPVMASCKLAPELSERLRNYVQWEASNGKPSFGISEAMVLALEDYLNFAENAYGGPYPLRTEEIKPGRRAKK